MCESQPIYAKRTREDVSGESTDANVQSVPMPTRENPSGNITLYPSRDGAEINFPRVHTDASTAKSFS